eukprot:5386257-Prymnesium_polylepis.1
MRALAQTGRLGRGGGVGGSAGAAGASSSHRRIVHYERCGARKRELLPTPALNACPDDQCDAFAASRPLVWLLAEPSFSLLSRV